MSCNLLPKIGTNNYTTLPGDAQKERFNGKRKVEKARINGLERGGGEGQGSNDTVNS